VAAAVAAVAGLGWLRAAGGGDEGLVLTSFGPAPPGSLEAAAEGLRQAFGLRPRRLASLPLTADDELPGRGQIDADRLLARLDALDLGRGERVLALVDADGGQRQRTFVLGLAAVGRRAAVVFLPRLSQDAAPGQARARLARLAAHEMGHVYGLSHCGDPACVMGFDENAAGLDARGPSFCPACARRLAYLRQH
jgi:archaemetzincin